MWVWILSLVVVLFIIKFAKTKRLNLPGPKPIPFLGNALQCPSQFLCKVTERWAFEFGPLYSFSFANQEFVVVSDLESVKYCLKERPHMFSRIKGFQKLSGELRLEGLFSYEGEVWRNNRHAVSPAYTISKVSQMKDIVVPELEVLRKDIEKVVKKQDDVVQDLQKVSFAFGHEEIIPPHFADDMNALLKKLGDRLLIPVPYWRWFRTKSDKEADAAADLINKVVDDILDKKEHTKTESKYSTFLDLLLSDGRSLSRREIRGNLITIILAGYDTSYATTMWMLYYLAKNPDVQDKLKAEVDRILPDGDYSNLNAWDFKYAFSIVKETLRLRPPGPLLFLSSNEDVVVNGVPLPKDTNILLHLRATSFRHFPGNDPYCFNPDRWVHNEIELTRSLSLSSMAFGDGPRICPGRHFALMELTLMLVVVFSQFEVGFMPALPSVDEPFQSDDTFAISTCALKNVNKKVKRGKE